MGRRGKVVRGDMAADVRHATRQGTPIIQRSLFFPFFLCFNFFGEGFESVKAWFPLRNGNRIIP